MLKKIIIIIIKLLRKADDDEVFSLSAQFSYYIILGIFPFIILLLSIFRHYTPHFYFLLDSAKSIIPSDVYNILYSIIGDSTGNYNKPYMSVSIITLLWSASSASVGIIRGINKAYDYPVKRNYIFMKIKGIIFTFALMFSLQLIFTFIVAGRHLIIYLRSISLFSNIIYLIIDIFRYVLPFIFLFFIFSMSYKYLPYEKVSFRFVLPGAFFSTIGCIAGSFLFSIYTTAKIVYYNNIYGSLTGIFVFIIWIYMSSFIYLIGAEINAFLSAEKTKHRK